MEYVVVCICMVSDTRLQTKLKVSVTMEYNNTDSEGSIDFTIQETRNGPVLAAFLSIIIVLSILTNSFIVIYTLLHRKPLKKESSIVLLFGLAATNLFLGTIILVFPTVNASAGEWVFGVNQMQKEVFCKLNGCLNSIILFIRHDMLALISIDRFLFIVKPLVHKQYFRPKHAAIVMVASWIILALFSVISLFTSGYAFYAPIYICLPRFDFIIILTVLIQVIVILVISITSTWTFLFTRNYLKSHHERVPQSNEQDSIYNRRVCKLFGLFSLMVMAQVIALALGIIGRIVETTVESGAPIELNHLFLCLLAYCQLSVFQQYSATSGRLCGMIYVEVPQLLEQHF